MLVCLCAAGRPAARTHPPPSHGGAAPAPRGCGCSAQCGPQPTDTCCVQLLEGHVNGRRRRHVPGFLRRKVLLSQPDQLGPRGPGCATEPHPLPAHTTACPGNREPQYRRPAGGCRIFPLAQDAGGRMRPRSYQYPMLSERDQHLRQIRGRNGRFIRTVPHVQPHSGEGRYRGQQLEVLPVLRRTAQM